MNRFFTIYGTIIVLLFSAATMRGYSVGSLFARAHHVGPNESHYHK